MTRDEVMKILETPIVKWQEMIGSMSHAERSGLEDALGLLTQRAALLVMYSEGISTGRSHESAADSAERAVVNVRKALVYSYPKNSPLHIP